MVFGLILGLTFWDFIALVVPCAKIRLRLVCFFLSRTLFWLRMELDCYALQCYFTFTEV